MSEDIFDQDREFGIDGEPDATIPGGGLAASGQVTMQKVTRQADPGADDGSDADAADVEETE